MRKLLYILFLFGCQDAAKPEYKVSKHELDSFKNKLISDDAKNTVTKAVADSKNSPVQITVSRVVKSESGNFRNVYLEYKNVSKKKIVGIKFNWYGENVFGEAADLGYNGIGGGFTDHSLSPGSSDDGEWDVLSNNLKKIKSAWATEVMFADGSKWVAQPNTQPN